MRSFIFQPLTGADQKFGLHKSCVLSNSRLELTYAPAHADALRALIVVDMGFRLRQSRRMRLLSRLPAPIYQDEADLLRRFRLLPT